MTAEHARADGIATAGISCIHVHTEPALAVETTKLWRLVELCCLARYWRISTSSAASFSISPSASHDDDLTAAALDQLWLQGYR